LNRPSDGSSLTDTLTVNHNGVGRVQVTDGGDGLQIRRVAANILNKQPRAADGGWSSSLGTGRGLTTSHRKTSNILRNMSQGLGTGRILWHDQSTEKWIDLALGMLGAFTGQARCDSSEGVGEL
jgi:hypothetical protein